MAIPKFLKFVNNIITEVTIAISSSAGAGDADKIPALDVTGKLDMSFLPSGIGADTQVITTSENLADGDLINIYNNGGVITARKADATTAGKYADGFVLAASTSGGNCIVYGIGTNSHMSGLTGGTQYLSTTAGGITATAPSASGNVVQQVGFATASTELWFQRQSPIILG
jgi:hypothetical protein